MVPYGLPGIFYLYTYFLQVHSGCIYPGSRCHCCSHFQLLQNLSNISAEKTRRIFCVNKHKIFWTQISEKKMLTCDHVGNLHYELYYVARAEHPEKTCWMSETATSTAHLQFKPALLSLHLAFSNLNPHFQFLHLPRHHAAANCHAHTHTNNNTRKISIAFLHCQWRSQRLKEGRERRDKGKERWEKELNPRLMAANKVWLWRTRPSGFLTDTCNRLGAQTVKEKDGRESFLLPQQVWKSGASLSKPQNESNLDEQQANCHRDRGA